MDTKKTALIITDGTDMAQKMAERVAVAITTYEVIVRTAESFEGTDLLAAHVFFIGCEKPAPPLFAKLEELLLHINLAGRRCGVFSDNAKALKYLSTLVKDSEAALGEPFLVNDVESCNVREWALGIVGQESR